MPAENSSYGPAERSARTPTSQPSPVPTAGTNCPHPHLASCEQFCFARDPRFSLGSGTINTTSSDVPIHVVPSSLASSMFPMLPPTRRIPCIAATVLHISRKLYSHYLIVVILPPLIGVFRASRRSSPFFLARGLKNLHPLFRRDPGERMYQDSTDNILQLGRTEARQHNYSTACIV